MSKTWFEELADSRPHDFAVGPKDDPYMLRWFITPRGNNGGIYLHYFMHDDEKRAFHDHPWDSVSILLSGRLRELRPNQEPAIIRPGDVVTRNAPHPHRLEVIERGFTLFITGPRIREWGFLCEQGWRHWTRFVNADNIGEVGIGCEGYTTEEIEKQPKNNVS
jgi:quercetin dioxygenase-like cupin family protein